MMKRKDVLELMGKALTVLPDDERDAYTEAFTDTCLMAALSMYATHRVGVAVDIVARVQQEGRPPTRRETRKLVAAFTWVAWTLSRCVTSGQQTGQQSQKRAEKVAEFTQKRRDAARVERKKKVDDLYNTMEQVRARLADLSRQSTERAAAAATANNQPEEGTADATAEG
jgi:hypothetical protein